MTKKEALARELNVVEDEILEKEDNVFEVDGEKYLVLTDAEADREFENQERDLIDDIGLDGFTDDFKDYIKYRYVDENWFEDWYREDCEYRVNEMTERDLKEELISANIIKLYDDFYDLDEKEKDNLKEELIDDLSALSDGEYIDEYINIFGEKDFWKTVSDYYLIDLNQVIEEIKAWDGRGPILAQYDGEERELYGTNYYAYRIN